jgi:L-alanine-DL-glutamate epimerase-like enolase superfamily enzyme
MKIKQCRLRLLHIPFVVVFKHSTKSRSDVESILVEVELESGIIGYGESLPRDYVTGETIQSVKDSLLNKVFPIMTGIELSSYEDTIKLLEEFESVIPNLEPHELCVKAAFELALLDAVGKSLNISVLDMLGGPKQESIKYSGVVSADNPAVVEQFLKQYKNFGIDTVKLKVGAEPERDLENIKIARNILGPKASIRIDANEAWNLEQAKQQLTILMEYNIDSVEQPMPAANKEDYPELLKYIDKRLLISLDESLCSYDDGKWMAENKGGSLFNLRISKNGGIINSLKLHKLAKENGIQCQLGAQVGETSLLSSAGLILASLVGDCVYHEGAFGTLLLEKDIVNHPIQFGKHGSLHIDQIRNLPGLGVTVDTSKLESVTQAIYT